MQVVFGGLAEDADEEQVCHQLEKVLETMGVKGGAERIFTYSDPSKIKTFHFRPKYWDPQEGERSRSDRGQRSEDVENNDALAKTNR